MFRFKTRHATGSCPDWKLCHAHERSSMRTSDSTCANENLGAHIFVQEVLGAHVKQTKIKLYLSGFQVLWSIMTLVRNSKCVGVHFFFKRVPFCVHFANFPVWDVATICFDAFEFAILNKIFSCRRLAIKLVRHIFNICNNEQ